MQMELISKITNEKKDWALMPARQVCWSSYQKQTLELPFKQLWNKHIKQEDGNLTF